MELNRKKIILEMVLRVADNLKAKESRLPSLKNELQQLKDIHEEIQEG